MRLAIIIPLLLGGCAGQLGLGLAGAQGVIGQVPGVLNVPTSVCVATLTQEMQTLGQLKAVLLGAPVPIAP